MSDIIIYHADDGQTRLKVHLDQKTVWLTQKQMAELVEKNTDTVGLHIRNIYKEGELEPGATASIRFARAPLRSHRHHA